MREYEDKPTYQRKYQAVIFVLPYLFTFIRNFMLRIIDTPSYFGAYCDWKSVLNLIQ